MVKPLADRDKLLADVIGASLRQTHQATNAVIDNLTRDLERTRARLEIVRERVQSLLDGPYIPNPDRIREALWVTDPDVDRYLDEHRSAS